MGCSQPHTCGTNKQLTDLIFQLDSSIFVVGLNIHIQCNNMRNSVTTKQYRTCCITAWQLENDRTNNNGEIFIYYYWRSPSHFFFIEVLPWCKFSPITRQQRKDMFWGAVPHLGLIARRWDTAFSLLAFWPLVQ